MATLEDVKTWRGMEMVDADGDKIGKIEDVYLDRQTGEPEWAAVRTGLFGLKHSFVPIRDAQPTGDGEIRVPFQKEQVKDAPRIDPDGELSADEERRLYEHYGRGDYAEWQGADRTSGLDLPAERERRFDRSGDGGTAMTDADPGTGTASGGDRSATAGASGAGDDIEPVVVGVRLRRIVVVAPEPDTSIVTGPDDPPRSSPPAP